MMASLFSEASISAMNFTGIRSPPCKNRRLINEHHLLDSRNLITLKNGDSSKPRNLSPAKYSYSNDWGGLSILRQDVGLPEATILFSFCCSGF